MSVWDVTHHLTAQHHVILLHPASGELSYQKLEQHFN